jgi:hypothetical protein
LASPVLPTECFYAFVLSRFDENLFDGFAAKVGKGKLF